MLCSTLIDDFGLKPLKSPHDEDLHDLIYERFERGATIVTSNLDFSEWGDAFPNKLLSAVTLDRLRHNAYRLVLDGESYRAQRPMPEGSKNISQNTVKNQAQNGQQFILFESLNHTQKVASLCRTWVAPLGRSVTLEAKTWESYVKPWAKNKNA